MTIKLEDIYGTTQVTGSKLPVGGTTGQVLAKRSTADDDVQWVTSTPNIFSGTTPPDPTLGQDGDLYFQG